jgi:hypothetical protein
MRKIFGHKRNEVAGRRKFPTEEPHNLSSSPKKYWNDKLKDNEIGGM